MTLPFRSPQDDMVDEFDYQNLVSFGTVDPSSLSPENHQM